MLISEKFKENMGAYSEEQGEPFHQDIRCYQGQYNEININVLIKKIKKKQSPRGLTAILYTFES